MPEDWAAGLSQRQAPGKSHARRTGLRRGAGRDAVFQRPGDVVADLLALVLERNLDGTTDCAADIGLRDPQAWRPLPAVF